MSGRGLVGAEDKTAHPRVLMFTTNESVAKAPSNP